MSGADVEACGIERIGLDVAFGKGEVAPAFGAGPRQAQQRLRDIEAKHPPAGGNRMGQRQAETAGTAADLEHLAARRQRRRQPPHRLPQ